MLGGSANLDYRSLYRNDEIMLVVNDREFAREHLSDMQQDKQHAEEISFEAWRARPVHTKLLDQFWSLIRTQL